MQLGLNLYRHTLTPDNFRFAQQAGATHIVAHLTNYFANARIPQASGRDGGWGEADDDGWGHDDLVRLRRSINDAGLELAALENISPQLWHDVLLDGSKKKQ